MHSPLWPIWRKFYSCPNLKFCPPMDLFCAVDKSESPCHIRYSDKGVPNDSFGPDLDSEVCPPLTRLCADSHPNPYLNSDTPSSPRQRSTSTWRSGSDLQRQIGQLGGFQRSATLACQVRGHRLLERKVSPALVIRPTNDICTRLTTDYNNPCHLFRSLPAP